MMLSAASGLTPDVNIDSFTDSLWKLFIHQNFKA